MLQKIFCLVLGFVLFFGLSDLLALTLKSATVEELTSKSEIVAYGNIQDCEAQSVNGQIWTYCSFEVQEIAKGKSVSETICVQQLGGTLQKSDGKMKGMVVPGQVSLQTGEEWVLFLSPSHKKDCYIIEGSNLGTFRVEERKINLDANRRGALILGDPQELQGKVSTKEFLKQIRLLSEGAKPHE
jgi:hypothetical protein